LAPGNPVYSSLELSRLHWRGGGVSLLVYRPVGSSAIGAATRPGRFIMFWYPGVESIPLAPFPAPGGIGLLVKTRGETTRLLVEKPPRWAGAIGPLGREAQLPRGRWLLVAGGTGAAAALQAAWSTGTGILVYGVRSAAEAAPLQGFIPPGCSLRYASEDGSIGFHGTVVEAAAELWRSGGFDHVFAAGPPAMLCAIAEVLPSERLYVSLEAHVRCGLGFCGKCGLGGGEKLLCRDGTVYPWRVARRLLDC